MKTTLAESIIMIDEKGTHHEVMPVTRTFDQRKVNGIEWIFVAGTNIGMPKTDFDKKSFTLPSQS